MSPSWRSPRFRVHLAADALLACEVDVRRGIRRVVRKVRLPFAAGGRAAAMQALGAWMAEGAVGAIPRRATQDWVLGIADVRYLLLPWTPDLADERLRSAFASALFERQFGQDPGAHVLRFETPTFGRAQLAASVPNTLLAEIEAHVHASRVRLRSTVPMLAAVWSRFHGVLRHECGTVHLVDGDRQVVVRHTHGWMHDVLLRPFAAGGGPESESEFEPLPLLRTPGARRRFFSAVPVSGQAPEAHLSLADGDGFSAAQDAAYAPALCGVM